MPNKSLRFDFKLKIIFWQCSGSMTFWCGSGSADPCLWLFSADQGIFVIDLQDVSKKLTFNTIFSACYFLRVHLHYFSKIKSQKESQNSGIQGFSYYFSFLHDDRRIRIQSRIRIHTSDQWIRIRIREAKKHVDPVDPDPEHCFLQYMNDETPGLRIFINQHLFEMLDLHWEYV